MRHIRRIHFVGIGGSGMSGIAEILVHEGYEVSGSDLIDNATTQHLKQLGAKIFQGHQAGYVKGTHVVVRSTAIADDNVELIAARKLRIPIVPRAMMLAELMRFRYGIAVAGTHGKTTTTSLVASLLAQKGLDPTFVIGGRLIKTNSHARLGSGPYLVAEADESDASFLYLQPMISIVTNIDNDHLRTYRNNFDDLKNSFLEFLSHLPFYGLAVLCLDDSVIRDIISKVQRTVITYGFNADADIRAINFKQVETKTYFSVIRPNHQEFLDIILNLPGQHNVLNALAVIAVATEIGIDDEIIKVTLENFSGVGRRFQILGNYEVQQGTVLMIDDYGHHPREIKATMLAIRQAWPDRRLIMIFQPHRYTRTRDLFDDFSYVLSEADVLLLLDVYSANEKPIASTDSKSLCANIRQRGKVDPIFVEDKIKLPSILENILKANDILLMQGAGDIGSIAAQLAASSLKNVN